MISHFKIRILFCVLVFLFLFIMVMPFGLIKAYDIDKDNRLLYEEKDYTYYFFGQDEYATSIIEGNGESVEELSFRLRISSKTDKDAKIFACMFDSCGNVVAKKEMDVFPRTRNDIYSMKVDCNLEKNEKYQIVISTNKDIGIYCKSATSSPVIVLHSSNQTSLKSAVFSVQISKICIFLLGLFLIVLIRKIPDEMIVSKLIPVVLSFVLEFVFLQYLTDHAIENGYYQNVGVFLIVVLALIGIIGFFCQKRVPMMSFVLLCSGIAMLVALPVGKVPDEANHFYRAYQLSEGKLFAKVYDEEKGVVGDMLPTSIMNFEDKESVVDTNDIGIVEFSNTALYAPVCYIPQIIGIKTAKLFTDNVQSIFVTARVFGFILAWILCTIALYFMPCCKEMLFIVMMFPTTLQEMMGITSDSMTMALAFLYIAFVLNLIQKERKLTQKEYSFLLLLGCMLGSCKIVYVVIVLMTLMLFEKPQNIFGLRIETKKLTLVMIPFVICIISNMLFGKAFISNGDNIDAKVQILYVLTHVFDTIMTVVRSMTTYGGMWTGEMIGDHLGQLDIRTNEIVVFVLLVIFAINTANGNSIRQLYRKRNIFILMFISISGFALILGSIYVTWNEVGDYLIRGIQGRYFTPVLPILGVGISTLFQKRRENIYGTIKASYPRQMERIVYDENGKVNIESGLCSCTDIILFMMLMITIVDIGKYCL